MWWVHYWNLLNYDSIERLGVPFGELPYKFAVGWARSIARVEGTHMNGKLQEESFKDYKQKKEQKADVGGILAIKEMGGRYNSLVVENNDYWTQLEKDYG